MALYRSPLTVTLWPSSFLKKDSTAHKAHQTVSVVVTNATCLTKSDRDLRNSSQFVGMERESSLDEQIWLVAQTIPRVFESQVRLLSMNHF
ncbi:hypothetical protein TNCV_2511341 [Trichonephila clavipes]|nr:hypothetical protein TNCV_2511341 [Trichonephila clavipes]